MWETHNTNPYLQIVIQTLKIIKKRDKIVRKEWGQLGLNRQTSKSKHACRGFSPNRKRLLFPSALVGELAPGGSWNLSVAGRSLPGRGGGCALALHALGGLCARRPLPPRLCLHLRAAAPGPIARVSLRPFSYGCSEMLLCLPSPHFYIERALSS